MSLSSERVEQLLQPYLSVSAGQGATTEHVQPLSVAALQQLVTYLELLLKWNARTNLTSVRKPEEIVCRHFGESLFLARSVRALLKAGATVLDLGSGAGFPGIPFQILHPELRVTLAESQGKKAAFLQEAVRALHLEAEIWPERAEKLPPTRLFDMVAMRAVDKWEEALVSAQRRVAPGGTLALLSSEAAPDLGPNFHSTSFPVPGAQKRHLWLCRR